MIKLGWLLLLAIGLISMGAMAQQAQVDEFVPEDADGNALNLDFEAGTLKDWKAEGSAFEKQPVRGDTIAARLGSSRSAHRGEWWVGTFENGAENAPQGTLTSVPFKVTHRWCSFFVSGGSGDQTCVEVVREKDGKVLARLPGNDAETLEHVSLEVTTEVGERIFIRLVDRSSGPWGHLNFDHFRFHASHPKQADNRNTLRGVAADEFAHAGLSPEDAARAMTLPEGFTATLSAGEPDVRQPIAMALDERGRLWVAENGSYPDWRPPEMGGECRVVVFEDVNGDGKFDKRILFIDNINFISGLEVGFGGVWIGAPPYLMFVPDKDGDDRPDGPARILLDGWEHQDTHETLNSFIWGPDGWLYGCHGVFTHSNVGKPGCAPEERRKINGAYWRYHPTQHQFEVFADGTSNPWGIDFDDRGQAFATACVIPHLYHVIQGARYQRQSGSHFNPHTFEDIKTIADHAHWAGSGGHRVSVGFSASAGGGHAHCGAMMYLGDNFPEHYRGKLLFNNIHGGRVNMDILEPKGSGFVGKHGTDFLLANDRWSQIINLRYGPDGAAYVIDWYDQQQCHAIKPDVHDRSNGRIFKVAYKAPPIVRVDLRKLGDGELAELVLHRNDWYVRHARKVLQERGLSGESRARLEEIAATHPDPTRTLRAMWALHAGGAFPEAKALQALGHADGHVRAWAIQLALEERKASPELLEKLADLARTDASPVVRLYLASGAQRLTLKERTPIVEALVAHGEDAGDHNLPLMDWYAAEPIVSGDLSSGAALIAKAKIPRLREFIARRVALAQDEAGLASLVDLLKISSDDARTRDVLRGIRDGFKGRRSVPMPAGWPAVRTKLTQGGDAVLTPLVQRISIVFGDADALGSFRDVLADPSAGVVARTGALETLLAAKDVKLPPLLLVLLDDAALRGAALRALGSYEHPGTPGRILEIYPKLEVSEKRDAINTLASQKSTAALLVEAIRTNRIPRADLTAASVRQMRELNDPDLTAWIEKEWGAVRLSPEAKLKEIAQWKQTLKAEGLGDPRKGRAIFARACMQCHTLFEAGGKVGPELTGSNRGDLDYLLSNILDPSSVIGKDYQAVTIRTMSGRVVTGIVRSEDATSMTLQTENDTLVLPIGEIDARRTSEISMMPESLLAPLGKDDVRDLMAYLQSPFQVPFVPGTTEPVLRKWTKLRVSDKFYAEGASVGDFNRDGKPDVVAGPFWIEGPAFEKLHPYAGVKEYDPLKYSENFFAHPWDFNKDGWTDIAIIGFPGADASWYENPRGGEGAWVRHLLMDPVDNESAAFLDVTGDEVPDLVCSTGGRLGYLTIADGAFHAVTPPGDYKKFTHGLGVGDVNGDGRKDLLEKDGWWEQPGALAGDPLWTLHPSPFGKGGAQMYAYDVNGDGLNDVITSIEAHGYGLSWFEQKRDGNFQEHLIVGRTEAENRYGVMFTQMHSLALADMDRDGLQDLVTGKRHWAHGPSRDPGAGDPAVLYWFKLVRRPDGVDFIPFLIDGNSGVGTQITAADVNGDGYPDVVIANKKGIFIHRGEARKVSPAEYDATLPMPLNR